MTRVIALVAATRISAPLAAASADDHRLHRHTGKFFHFLSETLTVRFGRAERLHALDLAHGAKGPHMGARLPAGAKHGEDFGVLARHMLGRYGTGHGDAQSLDHAVGKHRQGFAGLGGKQLDQANPLLTRRRRHFVLDHAIVALLPFDNVRV